jgi:hypothetical protein
MDGNDLGDPPPLEAYDEYLEANECMNVLYREPEATFDKYNPRSPEDEEDLS